MNLKDYMVEELPVSETVEETLLFRQLCRAAFVRYEKREYDSQAYALGETLGGLLFEISEGVMRGGESEEEALEQFIEGFRSQYDQWKRVQRNRI